MIEFLIYAFVSGLLLGGSGGYYLKDTFIKAEQVENLKTELDRKDKIASIASDTDNKLKTEQVKVETITKVITKEIVKYVPKIQIVNSECNLSIGTVRLLNNNASNKMPDSSFELDTTNTQSSTITGKDSIDYTNEIISKYKLAASQCNVLISYVKQVSALSEN